MEIPPKKPHFFKPILPGFKNGVKIPVGFFKYLKGHNHFKYAVLKRAGKKWRVKLNNHRFEEGNWGKFAEEFDLQLGNILVFRHEGNMEFEVSIFDSTHCDSEYHEYMEDEDGDGDGDGDEDEDEDEDEAATHKKPCEKSHFECTIGKYSLFKNFSFLPQKFALANGLTTKKCRLIVRDEGQKSWKLKLCSSNNLRARAYIGNGWRKFAAENCFKEGDRIKFEVITNGKIPIWKFQVVSDGETPVRMFREKPSPGIKLSNKTSSHAEAATNKPFDQSHFECTIRKYYLSSGRLYVPRQFALANDLIDKKYDLIIRDERQRSWNLKVRYWQTEVYIGDGCRKFIADNCLEVGDRIMFEVVSNEETPIWKFQVVSKAETPLQKFQDIMKKSSKTSPLNAQVSISTSGDDDHPYFISTFKPYCISRTEFYFPLDFAKSNGLMNRKCEMILKDEIERCWSVWIGRVRNNFGITRGWAKFRAENELRVGDTYKFELIKNGEIPIARFHCKYSAKLQRERNSEAT